MITRRKPAIWIGVMVLAVAFLGTGASKLAGTSAILWGGRFEQWGYPTNAHYVVGIIEVLCGVAVVIPRWRRMASMTLTILMAGALVTHTINMEFSRVIPPGVLGG